MSLLCSVGSTAFSSHAKKKPKSFAVFCKPLSYLPPISFLTSPPATVPLVLSTQAPPSWRVLTMASRFSPLAFVLFSPVWNALHWNLYMIPSCFFQVSGQSPLLKKTVLISLIEITVPQFYPLGLLISLNYSTFLCSAYCPLIYFLTDFFVTCFPPLKCKLLTGRDFVDVVERLVLRRACSPW